MSDAQLEELVAEKSQLLVELELAKAQGNKIKRSEIYHLASRVAALEGRVAWRLVGAGRIEDAIVNLISEASCLCDANRLTEAARIFQRALSLTKSDRTGQWIADQLANLKKRYTSSTSLSVFSEAKYFIEGNRSLRDPQIGAYKAAKEFFTKKSGHAVIQLPVGCGKSGTMSILPFGVSSGRVLVVAPNLEIRRNLLNSFDYSQESCFWRKTKVLSNGVHPNTSGLDSEANIFDADDANIVVTNIQQLSAKDGQWLSNFSPDYFDMILLDEGHHNAAPTWKTAVAHFPNAKVTSFTATPLRSDGQKVEGERIYRYPIAKAIRNGYIKNLASRKLEPIELSFTYKGQNQTHSLKEILKLREEEWFSKGVALSRECNKNIVDASVQCMEELRNNGKVKHQIIASACSVDHAKAICSLYRERKLAAEVIHSKMSSHEQDDIRNKLRNGAIDSIVQVQMFGEGADYPQLSVAAIFRPFRHLVPYVQFVGRIMRVTKENAPGDADNRGYVVSHIGLNIDRWWEDLRQLDEDDQIIFEDLARGRRHFSDSVESDDEEVEERKRFAPDMKVLNETIEFFTEEHFLEKETSLLVDDLINSMKLRGIDPEVLGISRAELERRLVEKKKSDQEVTKKSTRKRFVQPQVARKEARKRLDERVRAGAKQLLNDLTLSVVGFDLPKLYPQLGSTNNLGVATVLLNQEVNKYLNVSAQERDILSEQQMREAHDHMDKIIDAVVSQVRQKQGK